MASVTGRTKRRAPVTVDVGAEEDAAIGAAIAADPDTLEITGDMAASLRPARKPGQRGKM